MRYSARQALFFKAASDVISSDLGNTDIEMLEWGSIFPEAGGLKVR